MVSCTHPADAESEVQSCDLAALDREPRSVEYEAERSHIVSGPAVLPDRHERANPEDCSALPDTVHPFAVLRSRIR
jgi:hypothetical protein